MPVHPKKERPRRSRWWVWLLVLVGLAGVLVAAACAVTILPFVGGGGVKQGTVLELTLDGTMTEGPAADPFAELGLGSGAVSLWDLRRALRHAADDESVAALFVTVLYPEGGVAQLRELTEEIRRFDAKKPVHVLLAGDFIGDGSYYAATAGSTVWVTPAAFWAVNGLSADVMFFRGTLDKLHIEPQAIMMKEYKSAGEIFTQYEMSDFFRESLTDVVGDIQGEFTKDIAARRKIDESKVRAFVALGLTTSQQAKDAGLVDAIGYPDEIKTGLLKIAKTEEYESISVAKYLEGVPDEAGSGQAIAIVFGEGQIVAEPKSDNPFEGGGGMLHGPDVAEAIRLAAEDDDVKAIVFRVDSPGGSAVGSDYIWREIEQAQAKGKPVIVSMSSVAGSGGYWVAMGSDAIVADPATITGSIGVVFTKVNVRGFFEWIGTHVDSINFAENADIMSPFTSLDEVDHATTTAMVESLYEGFKAKVAEGRKLDAARVEELAKGRIWSGADAKAHGLVDELGGLDVAVALAATKAGLPADTRLVVYPEPKSFIELILEEELGVGAPEIDPIAARAFLEALARPQPLAITPEITLR